MASWRPCGFQSVFCAQGTGFAAAPHAPCSLHLQKKRASPCSLHLHARLLGLLAQGAPTSARGGQLAFPSMRSQQRSPSLCGGQSVVVFRRLHNTAWTSRAIRAKPGWHPFGAWRVSCLCAHPLETGPIPLGGARPEAVGMTRAGEAVFGQFLPINNGMLLARSNTTLGCSRPNLGNAQPGEVVF